MKKPNTSPLINRRARFDYDLGETYQAGLVLTGAEAKSVRFNHVNVRGAFVSFRDGELWLNNLAITPLSTNAAHLSEDAQTRPRKLLLNKNEVEALMAAKQQGKAIVLTKIINGRFIKAEIATATGKKKYDKRQKIKERTQSTEAKRAIKNSLR